MNETRIPMARGAFHALSAGDPAAPLVLCLHGFPDHAPSFAPMLGALAAAGFHAVAPWMRGYAPSVRVGPYDVDTLAEDVLRLADHLSPARPAMLVGHDWGAVVTYAALARWPERFSRAVTLAVPHPLAFVANAATTPPQLQRSAYMALFQLPFAAVLVERDDFAFIDDLWKKWSPGYEPTSVAMRALKRCLEASMPAPIRYYRAMAWPPGEALRRARELGGQRIEVPVLFLAGEDDGCITPSMARGQERYFAGELAAETIARAGHFLHLEQPAEVNAKVIDWLRRGA